MGIIKCWQNDDIYQAGKAMKKDKHSLLTKKWDFTWFKISRVCDISKWDFKIIQNNLLLICYIYIKILKYVTIMILLLRAHKKNLLKLSSSPQKRVSFPSPLIYIYIF